MEDGGNVDLTPYLGGGASGVINFAEEGGIEGAGANLATGQANWALLKTLETQQDSSGLPIYFPPGDWRLDPTVPTSWTSIHDSDYIEWDGPTTLMGAGKASTTLILPAQGFYNLFRQRTWVGDLTISDLHITSGPPANDPFTVNATTDVVTNAAHGYLNATTSLRFTSDTTLPAPLNEGRLVPIVIDANTFFLAGENGTYGLLTPRSIVGEPTGNTIDETGHGFTNGMSVAFYPLAGGVLPGGATQGVRHYVVNAATNTFQISLTVGGAAEDITSTGSGAIRCQQILDLTTAGAGTHTIWAMSETGVVNTGHHIGATPGSGLDIGTDRVTVNLLDIQVDYLGAFYKTNTDSAVDLNMTRVTGKDNVGVFTYIGAVASGTTEFVDYLRSDIKIMGCDFLGTKQTLSTPFGSHFFYIHTPVNAVLSGNTFRGCYTNAIQFQSENGTQPAGMQLVTGNHFDNNQTHIYGPQAEEKRSALNIIGNSFHRDGGIQLRGDAMVTGNYMEVYSTPAINIASTAGDVIQQPDVLSVTGNTFVIKSVTGSNAVFAFVRASEHKLTFADNIIKRDPDLTGTVYLGTAGDLTGVAKPTLIFKDNLYDITNGSERTDGWFIYEGLYQFENENFHNMVGMFQTQAAGDSSLIEINNCRYQPAALSAALRAGVMVNHAGWTVSGHDNKFLSAAFHQMSGDAYLEFAGGRNLTSIPSAATVYVDPSFDEHVVTGTTTIDTIDIGVSGNVAANGAGTNHNDTFTGSITLIVPSGLTISAAGNLANGPYTSTSADAITLVRQDNDTWLIRK